MDKTAIVETCEVRDSRPLWNDLSSVTFVANDVDSPGVLESALLDAIDDAGPSTVYTVILPEVGPFGYVYVDGDEIPAEQPGDWKITGKNADEIAASIRLLV